MIYKLYANKKSFKEISFDKGLNIIAGEKGDDSSKKSTRNGVGKTTLIKIINFCLGSNKDRLPFEELEGWIFSLVIDLFDEKITVRREVNKNEIFVEGNTENFPIEPNNHNDSKYYSLTNWKIILGKGLFNFEKDNSIKYNPTFRRLVHYFIRNNDEAYNHPFKAVTGQKSVEWQVDNAFLLGLNWKDASEAQEIKDEKDDIKNLKKIYKEHFLKDLGKGITKTKGGLETEKIKLESLIKENKNELARFEVNSQYKYYEKTANSHTNDINKLSDKRLILKQKLEQYKESIKSEASADSLDIEKIYNELGFYFENSIKKSLQLAKSFHSNLINNRKEFLEAEIINIKHAIVKIDELIDEENSKLSHIMKILDSSMALDKYRLLTDENTKNREKLEKIKSKLKDIDDIDIRENNLKIRKIEFGKIIKRDYEESKNSWSRAITLFDKNSKELYGKSGSLIIEYSEKGYKFKIEMDKGKSDGIRKMKIFCYDLTLLQLLSPKNINFLIHDSNIFYGVDERQVAFALHHIHEESIKRNIQYICTINSDDIPYNELKIHFKDFNIDKYIKRHLKDSSPSETLLGFAF